MINDIALNGLLGENIIPFSVKYKRSYSGHTVMVAEELKTLVESVDMGGGNCERKRVNCIAIAFATAVGAHIACGTVDFATLGISAYFCHGAAVLMQVAMSDNCNLDFKDCVKSADEEMPELEGPADAVTVEPIAEG